MFINAARFELLAANSQRPCQRLQYRQSRRILDFAPAVCVNVCLPVQSTADGQVDETA
jgi:hypothetical protein